MGDFMFILMIKIFFARLVDVSLNTVRTMFIVKGNKIGASTIAFFEILVWYYAVRVSLNTDEATVLIALAYALGYATGTLIGTFINDFFVTGIYSVNIISEVIQKKDLIKLRKNGYNASIISIDENKSMINLSINKKAYKKFLKLIKEIDNKCMIILSDAKIAYNGFSNCK